MLIRYHGHAQFLLESEEGLRLVTDPFPREVPFPYFELAADIVTGSHGHFDHNCFAKVTGSPVIVEGAGFHRPHPDVRITGYPSFHDDKQGALRGSNTIFAIHMEGLKIAHLGDLGDMPDADTMEALEGLDIMLVPVGGTYTLNAAAAADLVRRLKPRVVIPMHYKKQGLGMQNIAAADAFLTAMQPLVPSHQPLLRVAKGDISQAPPLCVLGLSAE